MEKNTKKTPEYTRRAIDKYRASKYNISISFPKEYGEILKATGESVNGYINRLVREDLTRRGLLSDASSAGTDAGGAVSECPF